MNTHDDTPTEVIVQRLRAEAVARRAAGDVATAQLLDEAAERLDSLQDRVDSLEDFDSRW